MSDFEASTDRAEGIALGWKPTRYEPVLHAYRLEALTTTGIGDVEATTGSRSAPRYEATYEIRRDDGPWIPTDDESSHFDADAPLGSLSVVALAIPDRVLGFLELNFEHEPSFRPTPARFELRMAGGTSPHILTATGARAAGSDLEVVWERGGPGPAPDFVALEGMTGVPAFDLDPDAEAPSYRARLTSSGASGLSSVVQGAVATYASISAGGHHTCGIREADGKVLCWGRNIEGQAPPEPSVHAFRSISAGHFHTCGIRETDGKVLCWGSNVHGQAPPGPSEDAFRSIGAGMFHTCGIREADDTIVCWGDDSSGQAPREASEEAFEGVAAGARHTCGIRATDGKVQCWGSNGQGQAPPEPSEEAFRSISAGTNHSCGIRAADGEIQCWGHDEYGRVPEALHEESFLDISAGFHHTCGILEPDGTIQCWGADYAGQISGRPTEGGFQHISAGTDHTCAIGADDQVTCWGSDSWARSTPVPGAFKSLATAGDNACGIRKEDGTVACWGRFADLVNRPSGTAYRAIAVRSFWSDVCGIREADGRVECWGVWDEGPSEDVFQDISSSDGHICGVRG